MALLESESIVLKSYDLAEADRIVVFFTRDFGLVRGVAKGVKRTKSKYGSAFEPFSQVKLTFLQKEERELVSIQNAELLRSEFGVAADPERLNTFSYLTEILLEFSQPHDPNETLYRMVKACFESELKTAEANDCLRLYFEIWLLRLSGYLPDWSGCSTCGRQFAEDETASISPESKLVCKNCDDRNSAKQIEPKLRTIYRNAKQFAPDQFIIQASQDLESIRDLRNLLRPILLSVTGRHTASAWAVEGGASK
ncbi:MAG: DNA repair protein RecO [Pyrinomonadaceae bacterium]